MRKRKPTLHQCQMLTVLERRGPLSYTEMELTFGCNWTKTWRALRRIGAVDFDDTALDGRGYKTMLMPTAA